ncbi:hypothetical protein M407DRAFT_83864 [Tulasnella calospora MUT 4182]|uniref:CxC6 like cysteine cluster associated with KDZ domain-containing protein n=1 Tax=Tulasnella calospora MUT 4182 TaxID=1051891 RepID=A0A0C3LAJ7_9AGAM|nr:hypothetical protein M407DRAFT_83864 [Tulasnella calospora MUT 4182]
MNDVDILPVLNSLNQLTPTERVPLQALIRFVTLTARFRHDIAVNQPPTAVFDDETPPMYLDNGTKAFLRKVLSLSDAAVDVLWSATRHVVWTGQTVPEAICDKDMEDLIDAMKDPDEDGPYVRSAISLHPPQLHCLNNISCDVQRRIQEAERKRIVAYTRMYGALPGYETKLYCRDCRTVYYSNYSVHGGQRRYYGGVPDYIQVANHVFLERELIEHFTLSMALAWTSVRNCTAMYNASPEMQDSGYRNWPFKYKLRSEYVSDAFTLLGLLEDRMENPSIGDLRLPDAGEQRFRLLEAMQERNFRMQSVGQPELRHHCNKCMEIIPDKSGGPAKKIHAAVMDGVTIGHPCCAVHGCRRPLESPKDRFCQSHNSHNNECVTVGCSELQETGFRTCADPEHRAKETHLQAQNKAISMPPKDLEDDESTDDEATSREVNVEGKSKKGRKIRALMGRMHSHNEQLMVRPCGVIVGRSTCFGAESPEQVIAFIKRLFHAPGSEPEYIFYDNNCTLAKTVKHDPFFTHIGLPVDVFHFKTKHKETDIFCQTHCNPASFPELMDGEKWRFNSSVAEQTNVWFGGFHSICREMQVDRYNFFLDEMIKRRNRLIVEKLRLEGAEPSHVILS